VIRGRAVSSVRNPHTEGCTENSHFARDFVECLGRIPRRPFLSLL